MSEVLLLARREIGRADQGRQTIQEHLGRYEGQLRDLLPNVINPQSPVGDLTQQVVDPVSPNTSEDYIAADSQQQTQSIKAFQHNGTVLFESSQLTAVSAVGIRTAQFPRTACTPWCSCVCHQRGSLQTPKLLQSILGTLLIGYSGLPVLTKPCDQHSCHLRARPTSSITYFFPRWFVARAISLILSSTPLAGPVATLKMQRTVSGDADVLNFAKLGQVEELKTLFEQGLASPHDVHFESGVTPLHVVSPHPLHVRCSWIVVSH